MKLRQELSQRLLFARWWLGNRLLKGVFRRALRTESQSVWGSSLMGQYKLPEENLEYPHAFKLIPTINFCVSTLQKVISALPLRFYFSPPGRDRREIEREALNVVDIWKTANTEQTGLELVRDLVGSLLIQGNAYLYLDDLGDMLSPLGTNRVQQFWVLNPLLIGPIPSKNNARVTAGYQVGNKREDVIPRDRIIHFRLYNPDHGLLGLSPLASLQLQYETHRDMARVMRLLYGHGGMAPGYFTHAEAIDVDVKQEMLEELADQMKPKNAWLAKILPMGLRFERAAMDMKEIAFVETHKLTQSDMMLVYGMHPMLAGHAEGTGLNSDMADVVDRWLYQNAAEPLCMLIQETLNENLFAKGRFGLNVTCEFDLSDVLPYQKIWLQRAKAYTEATGGPIMTRGFAMDEMGIPRPENEGDIDSLLVPSGMMTESDLEAERAQPDPATPAPGGTQRRASESRLTESRDRRDRLRVRAVRSRRPHERRMGRGWRRVFARQNVDFVAKLTAEEGRTRSALEVRAVNVDDLFEDDEQDRALLRRLIRAIVQQVGQAEIEALAQEIVFSATAKGRAKWISARAAESLKNVNEETRHRLRETLAEAEAANEALGEKIARVNEVFDGRRSPASIQRIARTETTPPYTFGQVEAWKDAGGAVEGKEWLTAQDDAVRDAHRELDGVVVPLDGFFTADGARADGPGGFGVAELDINCRCSLVASLTPVGQSQQESMPPEIERRIHSGLQYHALKAGAYPTNGHSKDLSAVAEFLAGAKK